MFRDVEYVRGAKESGQIAWPDYCYLPIAGFLSALQQNASRPQDLFRVAEVSALGTWRVGKIVIRFEPQIQQALMESSFEQIPSEVLLRLPVWGLYVELSPEGSAWLQGLSFQGFSMQGLQGFYVHLEYDTKRQRPELRILLDLESGFVPVPVLLDSPTLSDSWQDMISGLQVPQALHPQEVAQQTKPLLSAIISMLLYLCSEDDFSVRPSNPRPRRVKRGVGIHVASGPQIIYTGWKTAKRLQEAQQAGSGGGTSPTPHLRRAHWHTYKVGPGRQQSVVKWLHPVLVGAKESADVFVKRVKDPSPKVFV